MSTGVIVFAKAPVAGEAKTRLMPALGAQGAALLARRLLMQAISQALGSGADGVELCAAPHARHPALQGLVNVPGLSLADQGEGDLGERMNRAISRALGVHERVVLMGTDAPALTARVIAQSLRCLLSHDAVFAPAFDGGYALVGLSRAAPELFVDVSWGSAGVMGQTRAHAQALGLSWHELPAVHDIDEPADLVHLPPGWT